MADVTFTLSQLEEKLNQYELKRCDAIDKAYPTNDDAAIRAFDALERRMIEYRHAIETVRLLIEMEVI